MAKFLRGILDGYPFDGVIKRAILLFYFERLLTPAMTK